MKLNHSLWIVLCLCIASLTSQALATPSGSRLKDLTRSGFYIGATVNLNDLGGIYTSTAQGEYNLTVAENVMAMSALEPSLGVFDFSQADQVVAFAQARGMKMEGGPLLWAPTWYNPAWLTNGIANGTYSASAVQSIMQNYITTVMQHYKNNFPGVIISWEVVNEWTTTGTGIWATIDPGNPNYVVQLAFQAARAADPNAKLFYNDYNDEQSGGTAYNLVAPLKSMGLVDAVGFQSHFASPPNYSAVASTMSQYGSIGLQVYVTEFDYRIPSSNGTTANNPSDLQTQGSVYQNYLATCLAAPNCTQFNTWGFTDNDSWIPAYFPGLGAALPFDTNYNPKPAYYGLQAALAGAGGGSSPKPTPTPPPPPAPNYVGCYSDTSTRALPVTLASSGATVESCVAAAAAAGLAYAGVQYGGWCFGGNSPGYTLSANSNCNMPCAANSGEICGGTWFNSIYSTGTSISSPPTTQCMMKVPDCPNHQSAVGTFADNYQDGGYSVPSGSSQPECMQRAQDYYNWCGTTTPVSATYYINGTAAQTTTYP